MSIKKVVDGGYCVGCGACSALSGGSLVMKLDALGLYKPQGEENNISKLDGESVCPFLTHLDEDKIAHEFFDPTDGQYDSRVGHYLSLYAGYSNVGDYRKNGTSGGIISWVLSELFKQEKIDYVIHVKSANEGDGCLFKYCISTSIDEVKKGAKSRYYPIEASEVLMHVQNNPGRYAFVGVPCFIKAVRLLMLKDSRFNERILYCIGLVCGHLKSTGFAENYAWQAGIDPEKLKDIDFRVKRTGRPAIDYGVKLVSENQIKFRPTRSFYGYNWGYNFFRNPACNFCDDVFAETADIVVGDAWLPEYMSDDLGTSLVVVRKKELFQIIENAVDNGRLVLDPINVEQVVESQAGGIRDRREGLAVRLNHRIEEGKWVPHKRVNIDKYNVSESLKEKYLAREALGDKTLKLWCQARECGNWNLFERHIRKDVVQFEKLFMSNYRIFRSNIKHRLVRMFPALVKYLY